MTEKVNMQPEDKIFYHPDLFVIPENNEPPYLLGHKCEKCGKVWFPKLDMCPTCWSDRLAKISLSRVGKLYSYSIIHVGQKGIKTPYVIGYVDMPENVRIFAQIDIKPEDLQVGMDVEVVSGIIRLDQDGKPVVSYKFKAL